jgi:hypothetical protein
MTTLKNRSHQAALLSVLAANALGFLVLAGISLQLPTQMADMIHHLNLLAPAGIGFIMVGVMNSQLSADTKARIVFAKWNHPLPGAHAFTYFGPNDSRVDMVKLAQKMGKLPTDPAQQDRTWYGLYSPLKDDPRILNIHKDYLFYRDYAAAAVIILVVLPIAALWFIKSWSSELIYIALLLLQTILVIRAARDRGKRLVTTVLAIASHK